MKRLLIMLGILAAFLVTTFVGPVQARKPMTRTKPSVAARMTTHRKLSVAARLTTHRKHRTNRVNRNQSIFSPGHRTYVRTHRTNRVPVRTYRTAYRYRTVYRTRRVYRYQWIIAHGKRVRVRTYRTERVPVRIREAYRVPVSSFFTRRGG